MKRFAFLLLVPILSGCFSSSAPRTSDWSVDAAAPKAVTTEPSRFGVTRLSFVDVLAPYDEREIKVTCADGTLATDPYNLFAAVPSRLLRTPTLDLLAASGRFAAVVAPSSSANAAFVVEVSVSDLHLDATTRENDKTVCRAVVRLRLLVLDKSRAIVGDAVGEDTEIVQDGDFGKAFSAAFATAIKSALAKI